MRQRLLFIARDRDGWFYSSVGAHGSFVPTLARARFFSRPETAAEALQKLRERTPKGGYTLVDIEIDLAGLREAAPATVPEPPPPPITKGHPQAEVHTPRPAQGGTMEGHACPGCGNFSLIRNGTCLLCLTCGETTGCS